MGDIAAPGLQVFVTIKGTLDDGTVFDDSAEKSEWLDFVMGAAQVPKGLEAGIDGMSVGETRSFRVEAADGFGAPDPKRVFEVSADRLPPGCSVGTKLSLGGGTDGNKGPPAIVVELDDEKATLDLNHPLAGKALNYTVTLMKCKDLPALSLEITSPGDGQTYPQQGDELTVHYIG